MKAAVSEESHYVLVFTVSDTMKEHFFFLIQVFYRVLKIISI